MRKDICSCLSLHYITDKEKNVTFCRRGTNVRMIRIKTDYP